MIKNNISIPKKVINLDISYTLGLQLRNLNTDFTLGIADLDKYKYTSYDIDLILVQNFYLQMEAMEKMSLFLKLI